MTKLASEDYEDMCRSLAPQILALVAKANEGQCTPPLEVFITGADDDLVAHFEVKADGHMGEDYLLHCSDVLPDELRLKARYPVTVTVTDKTGKTWDAVFSQESIQ